MREKMDARGGGGTEKKVKRGETWEGRSERTGDKDKRKEMEHKKEKCWVAWPK